MTGQIVKAISNDYTVASDKLYICKARGKFRKEKITPLVGDYVEFDEKNNYILKINKRKNFLLRPPVANLDQAYLITSLKEPDLDTILLDKLIVICEYNSIDPIIVLTKSDLLKNKDEYLKTINYYKNLYQVFYNFETNEIIKTLKNKFSVFTGQSGAGKSTLLNKIDPSLNLKTGEISKVLNRGKHTTRHTEAVKLYDGYIADTPGFSALDITKIPKETIRDCFIEFGHNCKYSDCMHIKEEGCIVKERVEKGIILKSRYDNYVSFINEIGR